MARMTEQVQIGQKWVLKELEYGFELTLLPLDQPGPVVSEATPDFIVLEDESAGVTTRVPTYLIKVVTLAQAPAPAEPLPTTPPVPAAA